jgi:hypothetical protein
MRIKTFGLAIGIIACILLLFSILLFVPVEPSQAHPIIPENDKVLMSGYLAGNETDELIDNCNGTVSLLLYPVSPHTGNKTPVRIDNVSVIRQCYYTADGKKVVVGIQLWATEPAVNGIIILLDKGDGKIMISANTALGFYASDGYIRHPLDIKPAMESDVNALSVSYTDTGNASNSLAGNVLRLVPVSTGNETVYVQSFEKHPSGPAILWEHTFGNGSASAIIKTDDGGYLIAGHKEVTGSTGGAPAESQAWMGKVDAKGALQWEHAYNGSSIQAILQHNGDYVATGNIGENLWLLETDALGNVLIDRSYNNSTFTYVGASIVPIDDDGYLIAGNPVYAPYSYHAFVARVDTNLTVLWNNDLSGNGLSFGNAIIQANDNNFIVCGGEEGTIAKISAGGTVLWNATPDDHHGLLPVSICQADDGGYMVTYLDIKSSWHEGITVSKLNPDGTVAWSKTYYDVRTVYVRSMSRMDKGDYILSGNTFDAAGSLYLLKIDDAGMALWSAVYDSQDVSPGPIVQSDDGGYVMAASDNSQIKIVRFGSLLRNGFSSSGPVEA